MNRRPASVILCRRLGNVGSSLTASVGNYIAHDMVIGLFSLAVHFQSSTAFFCRLMFRLLSFCLLLLVVVLVRLVSA